MRRNTCKKCGKIIGNKKHICSKEHNLIGKKFEYLAVIKRVGADKHRHVIWKVKCVCGKIYNVLGQNLRNGNVRSCGCKYSELRGEVNGQKKLKGVSNMNTIFYLYKRNAKKRNIDFCLTKNEFKEITAKNCFYCNTKPSNEYKGHSESNGSFIYNGIDRIDNTKGYVIDNCVPCCKFCNWMKKDLTVERFLSHIEKIYNKRCVNNG